MTVKLDRAKTAAAVRNSAAFRAITRDLETRAPLLAVATAQQAGVQRDTGQYEDAFRATFTPVNQTVVLGRLRLVNTAPYAAILEAGSGPHVIRVRKAKVLYSAKTDTFFGTRVNHPGTRPYNVIRDTIRKLARGTR